MLSNSCRTVVDLLTAKTCLSPFGTPGRVKGKKPKWAAAGLAYEKKVGAAFIAAGVDVHCGQWFYFVDRNGPGHCQPDIFIVFEDVVVVVEVKLRWTPAGHLQVESLYKPVLEKVFGRPVVGGVLAKVLVPGQQTVICGDFASFIVGAKLGKRMCWQWLGNAALVPDAR